MRDINDVGDVGEGHIVIALHEHDLLSAGLENIFQAALQSVPSGVVLIDLDARIVARTVVNQLHHDGAIYVGLYLLILRRGLGHQRFQTLGRQRRDHHENDQQDQQHVNQRRDVHVRVLAPFGADCHTHIDLLYLLLHATVRPPAPMEWRPTAGQGFRTSFDPSKGRLDPRRQREHCRRRRPPSRTSPAGRP